MDDSFKRALRTVHERAVSATSTINALLSEHVGFEINLGFMHQLARHLPELACNEDEDADEEDCWRKQLQVYRSIIFDCMKEVATVSEIEMGEEVVSKGGAKSACLFVVLEGTIFEAKRPPDEIGRDAPLARFIPALEAPPTMTAHRPGAIVHEACFLIGQQPSPLTVADDDSWRTWQVERALRGETPSRESLVSSPMPEDGSFSFKRSPSRRSRAAEMSSASPSFSFKRRVSTDDLTSAKVAALELDEALALIEREPLLMSKLFRALSADLTVRRSERSSTMRKAASSLGYLRKYLAAEVSEAVEGEDTFESSAAEVALDFRLPPAEDDADRQLLLISECTVEVETNSDLEWRESGATVALFSSHLCIERAVMGLLVQRKAVPFQDVLHLGIEAAETKQEGDGTPGGQHGSRFSSVAVVSLKSGTWRIALPSKTSKEFCTKLEFARLSATDSSSLHQTAIISMENFQNVHGRWATLKASLSNITSPTSGTNSNLITVALQAERSRKRSLDFMAMQATSAAFALGPAVKLPPPAPLLRPPDVTAAPGSPDRITDSFTAEHASIANNLQGPEDLRRVLSDTDWHDLLAGARFQVHEKGGVVVRENTRPNGLFVIVSGTLGIQLKERGRPQSLILGRCQQGEIICETTYLLGTRPTVSVVCDSDKAVVARLPTSVLEQLFTSKPALAARFWCVVAMRTSARLEKLKQQDASEVKVKIDGASDAPSTMAALTANPAFFLIFHKFILSLKHTAELSPILDFLQKVNSIKGEPDVRVASALANHIFEDHMAPDATALLSCLSEKMRLEMQSKLQPSLLHTSLPALRHVYDLPVMTCMKHLDASMEDFQASPHYQYVLALKAKERMVPDIDYFRVVRMLGKGAFGNVLEVCKRDSECTYAMKVQDKSRLERAFGDTWDELALVERTLMASLHHPLLVNLAYAFQTAEHLALVMDVCLNGDLRKYATGNGKERLSVDQVRFVGLEAATALLYLHAQAVLYRDMKPENLLLDSAGHVRLIDFGVSKQGDPHSDEPTTSTELCGTAGYMAPEIKLIDETDTPYGAKADWFSFGVVLYQLTERAMPFGDDPDYQDFAAEYREPQLLGEEGAEIPDLFELLCDLLDWSPASRVSDETIRVAPYWGTADWELLDMGRYPSPMTTLACYMEDGREDQDISAGNVDIGTNLEEKSMLKEASKFAAVLAKSTHDQAAAAAVTNGKESSFRHKISTVEAEELEQKEVLMNVEGWDFVSPHALADEYVRAAGVSFSFV